MLSGKLVAGTCVGNRFQADGEEGDKGWIRYIGPVATSSNQEAIYVGVEWDLENRGKHDGTTGGQTYFKCPAGHGSFIHPKRVLPGMTLIQSAKHRYQADDYREDDGEEEGLYVLAKGGMDRPAYRLPVEFKGKEKVYSKLAQIHELDHVALNSMRACTVDTSSSTSLPETFAKATRLTIDNNLFYSWQQLAEITKRLKLVQLSASHNYLTDIVSSEPLVQESGEPGAASDITTLLVPGSRPLPALTFTPEMFGSSLHSLRALVLNNVPNAFAHVFELASAGSLPELGELHLCQNKIRSFPTAPNAPAPRVASEAGKYFACFPSLRLLNLSENEIDDWEEVWKFSRLPKLAKLLINTNKLSTLFYRPNEVAAASSAEVCDTQAQVEAEAQEEIKAGQYDTGRVPFQSLCWLSLVQNQFEDWTAVDAMNLYPQLTELRFQQNPVLEEVGNANARLLVIARMKKLSSYNLSVVRVRERSDAEKFYVGECSKKIREVVDAQDNEKTEKDIGALKKGYARYEELAAVHGDPLAMSLSGGSSSSSEDGTALKSKLIDVVLVNKATGKREAKKLSPNMSVADVKVLLSRMFKIPPLKVKLTLVNQQSSSSPLPSSSSSSSSSAPSAQPEELLDGMKPLSFYSVEANCEIIADKL